MKDELWLHAAISDDKVVADLLLRLKDSADAADSSPSASASTFFMKPLPPSWGIRQPRSKPSTSSLSISLSAPPEKKRDTRRSPTTPLSWTGGGASPSEGGCEESSSLNLHQQHPPSDRFRSKISAASDTPTASSKRPRRKKTFAELKEEECSLLKERTYLKKELATLRVTLKEQRSINENLKRIKLDLQVDSGLKSEPHSDPHESNMSFNGTCEAASSSVSAQVKTEYASVQLCLAQNGASSSQEPVFVLPDLNMSPDEECGVVGMS